MGTLDWMAAELRAAGVTVVEYPGWRSRHASGSFAPRAVIWHHDASAPGPSPNLPKMIAEIGNATTPPPLSQVWVDTAGRWHLTASGRANHAGIGSGWGRIRANNGNEDAIGIETDHTVGEAWPAAQLGSLRRGTAVLLRHLKANASDSLAGHKEYAPGRKTDPAGLDMAAERRAVAAINTEEDDMPTPAEVFGYNRVNDPRDMADYIVTGSNNADLAARTAAVNQAHIYKIEATVNGFAKALAAATADQNITEERLAEIMNAAVAEHSPTAEQIRDSLLPLLSQVIRDVNGEDNADQADAIVDELVKRLGNNGGN